MLLSAPAPQEVPSRSCVLQSWASPALPPIAFQQGHLVLNAKSGCRQVLLLELSAGCRGDGGEGWGDGAAGLVGVPGCCDRQDKVLLHFHRSLRLACQSVASSVPYFSISVPGTGRARPQRTAREDVHVASGQEG